MANGQCTQRGRRFFDRAGGGGGGHRALGPTKGTPAAQFARFSGLWRKGKEPSTKLEWDEPRTAVRPPCGANPPGPHTGARDARLNHKGAHDTRGGAHDTHGNHAAGAHNAHVRHAQGGGNWALRTQQCGEAGGGLPGQHLGFTHKETR